MTLTLHHVWRSSASRCVCLCLEERNLASESKVADMQAMEHHFPDYLMINPNGVVPALINDGKPFYESGTICEYVDECFPEPPLRSADLYDRARMRNWIRHADERIGNLTFLKWVLELASTALKWSDEGLAERLKRIPSKERQMACTDAPSGRH